MRRKKRLVLIDGHAILHRAFHAFPETLTTRKGEVVNAVYGFTRMLLAVISELKPEYLAVAFDTDRPTFRHAQYVGYQATRPRMAYELEDQIRRVQQVVQTLNTPIFMVPGYEADDVIGTLARQATEKLKNLPAGPLRSEASKAGKKTKKQKLVDEVIIVTGDRDMFQLVGPRVKVYAPQKGFANAIIFDTKKVKESLGVVPSQIVDYKGLVGDASDNYPGVRGIGPKTATQLLAQYGTTEKIYKNLKKLPEKVSLKLAEGIEEGVLSRKLAQIVTDVPIKLDLTACKVKDYDREKALTLFAELEFRSLMDKLPGEERERQNKSVSLKKEKKDEQMKLA